METITHFTPWSGLLGGLLIGLSAALLLWVNGRIAGISGIVGGLLSPAQGETAWRASFLIGMLAGGATYLLATGGLGVAVQVNTGLMAVAGLLVGFGTRLGGGCTSGHGVCGIGRLSQRSIVATGSFMLAAAVTVFVVRHVLGAAA